MTGSLGSPLGHGGAVTLGAALSLSLPPSAPTSAPPALARSMPGAVARPVRSWLAALLGSSRLRWALVLVLLGWLANRWPGLGRRLQAAWRAALDGGEPNQVRALCQGKAQLRDGGLAHARSPLPLRAVRAAGHVRAAAARRQPRWEPPPERSGD